MLKKRQFIAAAASLALAGCSTVSSTGNPPEKSMIVHSVFFKLVHAPASVEEVEFLRKASDLARIPGVENFKVLKETSPKNDFTFGLSMEFVDQTAYDGYNSHPEHVAFVNDVWLKEVADFMEIDHIPYQD